MPQSIRGLSGPLFYIVGAVTAIVAALYFAQPVLIPFTVSALLTFLLMPVVHRLQGMRVPRILAVLIVAGGAFLVLGGVGTLIGGQVVSLARQLPQYEQNIRQRIETVRGAIPIVERVTDRLQSISGGTPEETDAGGDQRPQTGGETGAGAEPPAEGEEEEREPVQVQVQEETSPLELLSSYLLPALNPLATIGLVIIFTLFMLLQPLDLGARLGQLLGPWQVELSAQMLNEAGRRISRYLLMQLLIASIYGVLVAVGLLLFGLPGALLWGLLAVLLRFIPYVGPWIAAGIPIILSLAVYPDWGAPIGIAAMFISLELFANNVLEPWLYGASTGLSPVAVILAMVFWGWLWGGVGLLLAVPMTVCLVVAGKYVPPLRVFPAVLGDRWMLAPHAVFYQFLATMQHDEAREMARSHTMKHSWLEMYDDLWLPALAMARQERDDGWTDAKQATRVMEAAGEIAREAMPGRHEVFEGERAREEVSSSALAIRCVPTAHEMDRLGARIFARLLQDLGYTNAAFSDREALLSGPNGSAAPGSPTANGEAVIVVLSVGESMRDAAEVCNGLNGRRVLLVVPKEERTGGTWWLRWRRWWHQPAAEMVRGFEQAIEAIGESADRSGGNESEPTQAAMVRARPATEG